MLHLDIKKPGIDGELLEELRQADMVDHVVTCLKQSDLRYRRLLKSATPWALPWWDTQHGEGNK